MVLSCPGQTNTHPTQSPMGNGGWSCCEVHRLHRAGQRFSLGPLSSWPAAMVAQARRCPAVITSVWLQEVLSLITPVGVRAQTCPRPKKLLPKIHLPGPPTGATAHSPPTVTTPPQWLKGLKCSCPLTDTSLPLATVAPGQGARPFLHAVLAPQQCPALRGSSRGLGPGSAPSEPRCRAV